MIRVYFDGACEPKNPGGTASYGVVILNDSGTLFECSEVFEPDPKNSRATSNNVAEYNGFIRALKFLKESKLQGEEIVIFGDSNLVICQMFGDQQLGGRKWQIKKGLYVKYAIIAQQLLLEFSKIRGQWIPREENTLADKLSKAELIKKGVDFKLQPIKSVDNYNLQN